MLAFPPPSFRASELAEAQRQLSQEIPDLLEAAGFHDAAVELWRRGVPQTEDESLALHPLLRRIQQTVGKRAAEVGAKLTRPPPRAYGYHGKDTTARLAWALIGTPEDPWGTVWRCQAIARACRAIVRTTRRNVEVLYAE